MESGTTPCNTCTSATLFALTAGSSPLGKGTYTVQTHFSKGHGVVSSDSSTFTVAGAQGDGAVAIIPASLLALAALIARRESRSGR